MAEPRGATVRVGESFDRAAVAGVQAGIDLALDGQAPLELDLSRTQRFDSAGVALIVDTIRKARNLGVPVRLRGPSAELVDYVSLVSIERLARAAPPSSRGSVLERIGAAWLAGRATVNDCAATWLAAARTLLLGSAQGRRLRLDQLVVVMHQAANAAVPITCLIGFLLGSILAMQAQVQLAVWGAEVLVADAVAMSITSEIGPLMTAILVAARSGSAIAAKLGTMVVSEEIDALRQMGIGKTEFLVLPNIAGLAIALPLLAVLFSVMAVIGGALFMALFAGIDPRIYGMQTRNALQASDLCMALVKCGLFGTLIGTVASTLGLGVRDGATGVGHATTNTVVVSIFLVILVDALFVALQRVVLA